jgi:hypothetical protein
MIVPSIYLDNESDARIATSSKKSLTSFRRGAAADLELQVQSDRRHDNWSSVSVVARV